MLHQPGARLSRRALFGTTALVALGACSADAPKPPTPPRTAPRFAGDPGAGRLYLGASLAIDEPAARRADLGGAQMSMVRRYYQPHQIGLMLEATRLDVAAGIVPFVSFKVPGTWEAVANGGFDGWLDRVLAALGSLAAPAFLALHHEPENDAGRPGFGRAAWIRMQERALARSRAFEMVTVVPVLMSWSFRARSRRDPQAWVVPAAPLLGVDMYNPWEPEGGQDWMEFVDLLAAVRRVIPDHPLVVPEMATTADPFDPLRASLWLRGAVDTGLRDDVVGMAWFDAESQTGRDRRLDDAGRAEFRDLLGRPQVVRYPEL